MTGGVMEADRPTGVTVTLINPRRFAAVTCTGSGTVAASLDPRGQRAVVLGDGRAPFAYRTFDLMTTNMKSRTYTMSARAHSTRATGERILEAALARFSTTDYDDVTLDAIAADAGVTVQTVIRRFGSKEGLVRTLADAQQVVVSSPRGEAPVGDIDAAIANLIEHYEQIGDLSMLLLRQEERVAPFADVTTSGKKLHADWVSRVFAPWLDGSRHRARLQAQLVAVCDVYTWYLLRRQAGLSRAETQRALIELTKGVLP